MYQASRSPLRWLIDAVRTNRSFGTVVARDAHAYLERLIVTSASRVTNDLRERVLESRRRLERELRDVLRSLFGRRARDRVRPRPARAWRRNFRY
jgi:hypothetical protein